MTSARHAVETDTIVVATDGSPGSDAALDWAVIEAQATGRHLLVVHASPLAGSVVLAPLTLAGFPDAATHGADVLRRAAEHCRRAGVTASTRLIEGSPAPSLTAISEGAAMLVVGARGQGPAATLLLGSVSNQCARQARCPVVIVRPRPAADTQRREQDQAAGVAVERRGPMVSPPGPSGSDRPTSR